MTAAISYMEVYMKSLNLRKLSLLSLLAGTLAFYDANAAAAEPGAVDPADVAPRISKPVAVPDPTADEVAAAIRPAHRTLIQRLCCCCSAQAQERLGDWVGLAARGFSFAAEHGGDVLRIAESIFGESVELNALKRAQSTAARANNKLSLVLNPKTGEFLEWDEALGRTTRKLSSLARIEYLNAKDDLHPAARLVISYFLDHTFELVLGADALSHDPAGLYKRLEESRKHFIDMFKEDADGKSHFKISASAVGDLTTARLRMLDEDGDGKYELGVAVTAGEDTVSLVDLVTQAREATAALLADPESQRINFGDFPLLRVLNNEYDLVNDDGTFKHRFEVAAVAGADGAPAVAAAADGGDAA